MPSPKIRSNYEVVIVGAGFAGAATAWALAELGVHDALLLEREPVCGVHSSGRNAGMVRTAVEDPVIASLAREGRAVIETLASSGDRVRYHRCGSLLLGAQTLPREVTSASGHRFISPAEAVRRVPLLAGAVREAVLYTPDDGIVEVDGLLQEFIATARTNGVTIALGAEAVRPRVVGSRVQGVSVGETKVDCRHLVVAAGAWSGEWGAQAGVPIALEPRRRHIVCTEDPVDMSSRGWPWVWDLEAGFYFRPEASGLLWSPCDETRERAGDAVADPEAARWLAEKITPRIERAGELVKTRSWAGHRTFTPDGRFLLGPDPRIEGWHWAVGLGGHGVTVAGAIGRRVAGAIAGRTEVEPSLGFRPEVLERIAS